MISINILNSLVGITPLTEPCWRYLRTRLLNNTLHFKPIINTLSMPNAEFFHNSIKHTSSSYLCWLFQLCVAILLSHFNRFCARCLFPYKAVVIVMAFPPEKLLSFIGTTPPSDFLSCISCSYFIIACSTYSLFLRDILGSPELPTVGSLGEAWHAG